MNDMFEGVQLIELILNFGVVPIIALLWKMNNRIYDLEIIMKSNYITREEFSELMKLKVDKRK